MTGLAQKKRTDTAARLIKAVQTCRRQVAGLAEDEAWRDMLEQLTGKRSLRQMTNAELGAVLTELHAKGAPPAPGKSKTVPSSTKPWVWKIRQLWKSLDALGGLPDGDESTLRGFCRRQTRSEHRPDGVSDVTFLGPEDAHSVIEALKERCKREGFDASPDATSLKAINMVRARAGLEQVKDGWRQKLNLVHALLAKLPEAAGVAQLGDPPCATSDMTAAELDRAIEDLGAAVRRAKAEASA